MKIHTTNDSTRIDILNNLAFEYLNKNPKILREHISEAQKIIGLVDYPKGVARIYSILGSAFWVEGEFSFALDYFLQSLKMYENIDDKNGIYTCYNNIGEVYKKLNNYTLSLKYHKQSLELKEKYLKGKSPVLSYINIAEIYLKTGELQMSKEYFEKALILAVESDNINAKAYAYAGLGQVTYALGDAQTGLFKLEKSLDIRKKSENLLGMVISADIIGDIYYETDKFNQAGKYYLLAMKTAIQLGAKEYEINSYKKLFKLDSAKGNYKKSLIYNYKFNHLRDSLYSMEKESQLARIKTIYEVDKKDKENALLLKDKQSNAEMQRYQTMINIVGVLILWVLVVMSIALYRQLKSQKKTHDLLQIKSEEINTQKNKLILSATTLKELNENLEKTVKERTGIILKKNEKLREFAYMNAHNVRGPLSNILGLTYLLKKEEMTKEHKDLVTHLNTSAEKLDTEFHQLRTYMENEERS